MSTLSHFLLDPGCEDYWFFPSGQGIADFQHDLDSTPTTPIETLELDASFDESDGVLLQSLQGSYAQLVQL